MPGTRKTVLILGGTREASDLAAQLANRSDLRVITSFAGRTAHPQAVAGETRIGGFGGIVGLTSYLSDTGIDLLVDATHPFAITISTHAAEACQRTGTPMMSFVRPPWQPVDGDKWQTVASLEEACTLLPAASRAFLALGHQHIAVFSRRSDVHCIIRMVDPPAENLPFRAVELIVGKPGDISQEEDLLRSRSIDHLVCRNSGGGASYAKIEAARRLAIPVIMIERPPVSAGHAFDTIADLAAAIG